MKLQKHYHEIITEYGHLIVNTGGNDIIELCERTDATLFSNPAVVLLQSCVQSQLDLLLKLKNEGLLK